jgi:hypothetical protein
MSASGRPASRHAPAIGQQSFLSAQFAKIGFPLPRRNFTELQGTEQHIAKLKKQDV